MTPHQVKKCAVEAATHDDYQLALKACRAIADQDLYLNVPKPASTSQGRVIVTRWGNRPCKGGCGKMIPVGTEVWWEPNWGVSHLECHI